MTDLRKTPLRRLLLLSALIGGGSPAVERIALGNPLTFLTDLARPLKSLLIPFTPQQEGTGDPSPSNIRSILPWNGLSVGQINGNAPTISNNSGMSNADGEWKNTVTDSKTRFDAYIQLYKDSSYIKGVGNKSISASGVYSITFNVDDANCNRIVFLHSGSQNNLSVRFPFNLPQGTYTISFNVVSANPSVVGGLAIKDIFLVAGSDVQRTDTDIVFPSPVYGGTLDVVSGVLTVEYIAHTFTANDPLYQYGEYTGGIRINTNVLDNTKVGGSSAICNIAQKLNSVPATIDSLSYRISGGTSRTAFFIPDSMFDGGATVDKFKEWLSENEFTICAELETPQEQTLTGHQITALVGDNTIWSDADGSMTAVYLKKA